MIQIFRRPAYLVLALTIFLLALALAIYLPNLTFLKHMAGSSTLTLSQKAAIFWALLGGISTNFLPLGRMVTITASVLIGVQVSLLVFYLRRQSQWGQACAVSGMGIITSFFGVGCAACGSVVLTSLIGLAALTAALGLLPFKGQEIGFLGVGILSWSVFSTVNKIRRLESVTPARTPEKLAR